VTLDILLNLSGLLFSDVQNETRGCNLVHRRQVVKVSFFLSLRVKAKHPVPNIEKNPQVGLLYAEVHASPHNLKTASGSLLLAVTSPQAFLTSHRMPANVTPPPSMRLMTTVPTFWLH
jgi:hypothetical protein